MNRGERIGQFKCLALRLNNSKKETKRITIKSLQNIEF